MADSTPSGTNSNEYKNKNIKIQKKYKNRCKPKKIKYKKYYKYILNIEPTINIENIKKEKIK